MIDFSPFTTGISCRNKIITIFLKKTLLLKYENHNLIFNPSQNKNPNLYNDNHQGDKEAPVAPWSGYQNEEDLKEKILALSADSRNFLRAPPGGVNFDLETSGVAAHALVLLKVDTTPSMQVRYLALVGSDPVHFE
jgi:hypothetical protein